MQFCFLRDDNGEGSFPENDPKIQDIINSMNYLWSSISDPSDCSTLSYPFDSKVRFSVNVHYIDDTEV
jgi:hypothetical protein